VNSRNHNTAPAVLPEFNRIYAQALLVMERFGYPNFFRATADELINGQYRTG
jgi:hypothetical protein